MDRLPQDIRHAIARLIRDRGFAAITIVTLALGIGANTAVFSLVKAALLSPLPYGDADRLTSIWGPDRAEATHLSLQRGLHLSARSRRASSTSPATRNTTRASPADRSRSWCAAGSATPNLFEVTRTPAMLGRTFTPADTAGGTSDVIVISHGLWQRRFGGDADIIGQSDPGERPRAHDHRRDAGVVPAAERLSRRCGPRKRGCPRWSNPSNLGAWGSRSYSGLGAAERRCDAAAAHRASCRSSPSGG